MAERIYTIPVNEIFAEQGGCPICRLRNLLEERSLEYVLGPAMMESDVRIETNRKGFCKEHLFKMAARRSRLPLALMLETHLDEVAKNIQKKKSRPSKKEMKERSLAPDSCYVCDRIAWGEQRMYATIAKLYGEEMTFREQFRAQSGLCLLHYRELFAFSAPAVPSRWRGEFERDIDRLTLQALSAIREDVHGFTQLFDYRNAEEKENLKNTRDSIERAIEFLSSRNPEEEK